MPRVEQAGAKVRDSGEVHARPAKTGAGTLSQPRAGGPPRAANDVSLIGLDCLGLRIQTIRIGRNCEEP